MAKITPINELPDEYLVLTAERCRESAIRTRALGGQAPAEDGYARALDYIIVLRAENRILRTQLTYEKKPGVRQLA